MHNPVWLGRGAIGLGLKCQDKAKYRFVVHGHIGAHGLGAELGCFE